MAVFGLRVRPDDLSAVILGRSADRRLGIAAFVQPHHNVQTNGEVSEITNTDPGIVINPPQPIPGLSVPALVLLAGLLAAAGMRASRRTLA